MEYRNSWCLQGESRDSPDQNEWTYDRKSRQTKESLQPEAQRVPLYQKAVYITKGKGEYLPRKTHVHYMYTIYIYIYVCILPATQETKPTHCRCIVWNSSDQQHPRTWMHGSKRQFNHFCVYSEFGATSNDKMIWCIPS